MIIAITVAEIRGCAPRGVRGVVLSLREQPFVEGAIASGTRVPAIIWRHILPNTWHGHRAGDLYLRAAMIIEAVLSFIGAGTRPTDRAGVISWLRSRRGR